jgi:hypothetical protein
LRKRLGIEGREHHQKVNPFYRGSAGGQPIKFLSWDESLQCELLIEQTGRDQAGHLVQLILRGQAGPCHYIPLTSKMTIESLRQKVVALKLTFPLPEVRLIHDPVTEQWAVDLFKQLWPDVTMPDTTKGASSFSGGKVQFEVTDRYFRAIAKIGFHYFLTQFPNYSGHESIFSGIRDFCQGRSKTRPVGRSKSRPVVGSQDVEYSGEKGRWSVAEAALFPRGASGRGRVQRSEDEARLRRLCLRR